MHTNKIRILFVDDDKNITTVWNTVLKHFGFDVTTYNDPIDALHRFKQSPEMFDLLLTDFKMPKLNGAELINQVKQISPITKTMIVTGYIADCPDNSADLVLSKPLDPLDLFDNVNRLFA